MASLSFDTLVDIVSIDHRPVGSREAFFKDSMRRDAIIGVRIEFALREASECQSPGGSSVLKVNLHRGSERELYVALNIRTR